MLLHAHTLTHTHMHICTHTHTPHNTHTHLVKAQVNGDLRLSGYGASKLAGRLEIYHGGKWGTVCAQGRYDFEMIAASVACRQLGLGFVTDWYGVHAPSGLRWVCTEHRFCMHE